MKRGRLLLVVGALTLLSCKDGKGPVLQAEFCLTPQHDADELRRAFHEIARDEGLDYIEIGDRTINLAPGAKTYENAGRQLPSSTTVTVSSKDDKFGFTATIAGYPTNDVLMGFLDGYDDRKLSMAFARRVVAQLRQKWDLHLASGDIGMRGLNNCAQQLDDKPR